MFVLQIKIAVNEGTSHLIENIVYSVRRLKVLFKAGLFELIHI